MHPGRGRGRRPSLHDGVDRRAQLVFIVGQWGEDEAPKGWLTLYPRGGGWAAQREGMVETEVFCTSFDAALRYLGGSIDEVTFRGMGGQHGATPRATYAARLVVHDRIVAARRAELDAKTARLFDADEVDGEALRALHLAEGAQRELRAMFAEARR